MDVGSIWPSTEIYQLNIYVIYHDLSQVFTKVVEKTW